MLNPHDAVGDGWRRWRSCGRWRGPARPARGGRCLVLDAGRTQALQDRRHDGATVNDLLFAALHLCVDKGMQSTGTSAGASASSCR